MWFLIFLGASLHQGCLAQVWSPPQRGQADIFPRAPNWAGLPVAQPYAPHSRAAPLRSHAVAVTCEPHRMVVTVHRDLFGVGSLVAPADLTLGVPPCFPVSFDAVANVVVFEAGLHECGSAVQMTPDSLIYRTSLFYTPSFATNPIIVRTNAAETPIECHYPRRVNLTSRAFQPTWAPFRSTVSAEARLGFSLRLMRDDWSAERTSAHFQLGDTLRLQADIHVENQLPLRLFVDSCVAGLSPDAASVGQYAIVDSHGCLVDGRQDSVSSTFLSPRPRQESLRFTVDAFRFAGEPRDLIYITCRLKVTPAEQTPDELNKACSFSAAAGAWLPVEGAQSICRCCSSQNCGHSGGVQPHSFSPRLEMSWQRSLPAETAARQTQLVLGPLLVSDARESVGILPDEPAEDEEMVMEGETSGSCYWPLAGEPMLQKRLLAKSLHQRSPSFPKEDGQPYRKRWTSLVVDFQEERTKEEFLPVIKPKAEGTGTRFPFKEQRGPVSVSAEEQKLEPALPWEAYVRGGPFVLGGEGDGSGFGEQAKADVPEGSAALEFKAEVVSRPRGDASPSRAPGESPREAFNLAAKGPEQPSGGVALLRSPLLVAGGGVTLLSLGMLLLLRRRRHSNSARRPSALSAKL